MMEVNPNTVFFGSLCVFFSALGGELAEAFFGLEITLTPFFLVTVSVFQP